MISFKKGHLLTIERIINKNDKNFIKVGSQFIEVEIKEQIKPGEKLFVSSVSKKKIFLKPYSTVLKDLAFKDIIYSLDLPETSTTNRLLQTFLNLGIPLRKELLKKLYSKIYRSLWSKLHSFCFSWTI